VEINYRPMITAAFCISRHLNCRHCYRNR